MFAIATRSSTSNSIRTWRLVDGLLVDQKTFDAGSSQVLESALSPDGKWFVYGQTSGVSLRFRSVDDGDMGAMQNFPDAPDVTQSRPGNFSGDGQYLVVAHQRSGSGKYAGNSLTVYRHEDGVFTYVTSADTGGDSTTASISPDGKHVIANITSTGTTVRLYAFDGESLSLLRSGDGGSGNSKVAVNFIGNDRAALGESIVSRVVDISNLSAEVSTAGGGLQKDVRFSESYTVSGSDASGGELRVHGKDNLSMTSNLSSDHRRNPAISADEGMVVAHNATELRLYSWDGSSLSVLDTGAFSSTVNGAHIWPYYIPDQPPTPEEIFRTTFAEASGRPPYMTAVNNAGAVQRLANHNVSLWAGKPGSWKGSPRVYRVPVEHIGYGELHKVTVGNVVDINVNQPGLENTKRMKIQVIDAPLRSGPVTLTCIGWDSDD